MNVFASISEMSFYGESIRVEHYNDSQAYISTGNRPPTTETFVHQL